MSAVSFLKQVHRCGSSLLRKSLHLNSWNAAHIRTMSSGSELISVNVDDKTGICIMKLQKPPVNSLSLEYLTEITIAMEKLENEKTCRGVILTSGVPKIFSAGLDILEMYQPQRDRLQQFWRQLQEVWISLYGSSMVTLAAINGHSPAGGCLLAMCCDYRMMAPNFTIGLNETQLGIIPPFWFVETMKNTCGRRQTELCTQKGLMLTTDEAHKIGMVDQVVPLDSIESSAIEEMQQWLKLPDVARQITKMAQRKETLDKLLTKREEDIENFCNFVTRDPVQKTLEVYLQRLKAKQK